MVTSMTNDEVVVSALRLNILRAYYALMALGTAAIFWPPLVHHTAAWGVDNGAQYSLLGALTPFAIVGLRYPLKMLPIILYEFLWKAIWFIFVVLPLFSADQMTDVEWSNVFACGIAIVLTPIVMPWRYFVQTYLRDAGDRWR
jgi:hypothetical protein